MTSQCIYSIMMLQLVLFSFDIIIQKFTQILAQLTKIASTTDHHAHLPLDQKETVSVVLGKQPDPEHP